MPVCAWIFNTVAARVAIIRSMLTNAVMATWLTYAIMAVMPKKLPTAVSMLTQVLGLLEMQMGFAAALMQKSLQLL